mmetsp:Transcript_5005/g.14401  ORF Transcript_5005/g.14401 Transcript_5005/m.14401 type:complete len:233 (+) Transcript_5005:688-1386(+)
MLHSIAIHHVGRWTLGNLWSTTPRGGPFSKVHGSKGTSGSGNEWGPVMGWASADVSTTAGSPRLNRARFTSSTVAPSAVGLPSASSSMAFMSPEGHMSASCSRAGSRHSSAAPGNHITCTPTAGSDRWRRAVRSIRLEGTSSTSSSEYTTDSLPRWSSGAPHISRPRGENPAMLRASRLGGSTANSPCSCADTRRQSAIKLRYHSRWSLRSPADHIARRKVTRLLCCSAASS